MTKPGTVKENVSRFPSTSGVVEVGRVASMNVIQNSAIVRKPVPGGQCQPKIFVVMGVCGCGKSTIAQVLSARLDCRFIEADDFHSKANIEKMRSGTPLTDEDRWPWLDALAQELAEHVAKSGAAVLVHPYSRSGAGVLMLARYSQEWGRVCWCGLIPGVGQLCWCIKFPQGVGQLCWCILQGKGRSEAAVLVHLSVGCGAAVLEWISCADSALFWEEVGYDGAALFQEWGRCAGAALFWEWGS
ncbi:hypothetical protein CYMTET_35053 [Cymbomonas tetramitiformis]|uniref:gluconokinase n=1 Tax=Cymbomonas tetramitiformis TaxID=36881 RepID=A0AAE0KPJ6_9CHLO|nr:hypothetical protein CYMTET_35053 [Cymbomonas tetramitiformis]